MIWKVDPDDQEQTQQTDSEVEDPVGGIEGATDEDDRLDEADYFDEEDED